MNPAKRRQTKRAVPSKTCLPDSVADTLRSLTVKLKGEVIGRRIWENVLSPNEQGLLLLKEFLADHPVDTYAHLRRVSRERAVLDLAHQVELLSDRQYHELLAHIGAVDRSSLDRPSWNADRLELSLRGRVIRRIRSRTRGANIVRVLDVFEELKWPDRIDDPLRRGGDDERLRDTVKSLNRGLSGLRFRADGTGRGILWELV